MATSSVRKLRSTRRPRWAAVGLVEHTHPAAPLLSDPVMRNGGPAKKGAPQEPANAVSHIIRERQANSSAQPDVQAVEETQGERQHQSTKRTASLQAPAPSIRTCRNRGRYSSRAW